jgi:hypothetical protein
VIVEGITVDVAQVVSFGDTQHYTLHEVVVVAHDILRRHLFEIPRPDAVFERFEHGVLADTGGAAENDSVIDLDGGVLDSVRAVRDDVPGIVRVNPVNQLDPAIRAG